MERFFEQDKCINVEPSRCFYVPFDKSQKRDSDYRKSKRYLSLNGKWNIKGYSSFEEASNFLYDGFDKEIEVPSCVQYFGYDYFQYTNYRYPIPYNPPFVPKNNPCFHYSKVVNLNKNNLDPFLVFEGVDSAFYLYVNNSFVGYSYISHRISEFDISKYIVDGANKIDILVLKWSLGTYLEDQDKWRFTGIFRNIYVLFRDHRHISDYKIETSLNGELTFKNRSDVDVYISLEGITKNVPSKTEAKIIVRNVKLWSAEEPNLYNLDIVSGDEIIYEEIGFRTSEIKDGKYLFNNKPIKLLGINRHDFHPKKGMAVSEEDIYNDLLLMKSLNINAIRTSHYPSSPYLYKMCDRLGFYVMSESDVETHGTTIAYFDGLKYFEGLNMGPEEVLFKESLLLRQICNVEEHKNFASVIMFSLGNESGWGTNIVEGLELLHKLDSRPIHYEGLFAYQSVYGKTDEYYKANVDVVSQMYSTIDKIKEDSILDPKESRPFVLCEYEHAMGNGPGGLDEYWDLIESDERLMGAFMWEWCEHGIEYNGKKDLYGGDFNEPYNDFNFCLDGIVTADRKFKAGTIALRHAYQPLIIKEKDKKIVIKNRNYFKDFKGDLFISSVRENIAKSIVLKPQEIISFDKPDGDVNITVKCGNQLIANQSLFTLKNQLLFNEEKVDVKVEDADEFVVIIKNAITYKINKNNGCFAVKNNDFASFLPNFYRTNIDNDIYARKIWDKYFLSDSNVIVTSTKINGHKVIQNCILKHDDADPTFAFILTYDFDKKDVLINMKYECLIKEEIPYLPRVGLMGQINKRISSIEYNGFGPEMTYCDLYKFASYSIHKDNIKNQYFHFAKPQENGLHYKPEYFKIFDDKNSLTIRGAESVMYIPYSQQTIKNTMHDFELKEDKENYLYIDFCQSGLGTNACGPIPDKSCQISLSGENSFVIEVK